MLLIAFPKILYSPECFPVGDGQPHLVFFPFPSTSNYVDSNFDKKRSCLFIFFIDPMGTKKKNSVEYDFSEIFIPLQSLKWNLLVLLRSYLVHSIWKKVNIYQDTKKRCRKQQQQSHRIVRCRKRYISIKHFSFISAAAISNHFKLSRQEKLTVHQKMIG